MSRLSPTERTQIKRGDRARTDRSELLDILDAALICHLGLIMDGHPVVLPTVFGVDVDGPDRNGTLYLHGSVAAQSLVTAPDVDLCVTCTHLDGLVLARSGFHHSMNYRSAVIIGRGRLVTDESEKRRALDRVVDQVVPDRSATLRAHTRKEMAATTVVAVSLHEASVKVRRGGPVDDPADLDSGQWAGVLPLRVVGGDLESVPEARLVDVPSEVLARAQSFA